LTVPRRWDIGDITRYMLVMGPVSSLFDYLTFGAMIFILHAWDNPALFQTGWFVESLLSQTLIIHVLRTSKIPFLESNASPALTGTTAVVCLSG
ncbi:cation transporting ATPase C-terminal domain-containing protein, partial [Klebsiella pneumoniae]